MHFAFWGLGAKQQMFFWIAYPVIDFCSAAAWSIYSKQSEQMHGTILTPQPE
jgi:hypothetical protein